MKHPFSNDMPDPSDTGLETVRVCADREGPRQQRPLPSPHSPAREPEGDTPSCAHSPSSAP